MNHFPIFVALEGRRVLVVGGGDAAVAKLRLLLKTTANINVVAETFDPVIETWAAEGRVTLIRRAQEPGDALCCVLAYAASEDAALDARTVRLASADGALVNVVDNLEASQFITPAIVDRDPVVVAIGTEGAAPVLARKIKAELEAKLPAQLGLLARIGKTFRKAADVLPMGAVRRRFWADYYDHAGPRAADAGEDAIRDTLGDLLASHVAAEDRPGHVDLVGAGPGDPELLTLKARTALDRADVVIHDRLVAPEILELARREALIIDAGKEGFGPSTAQGDINDLMVAHGLKGAHVVRLKAGDPTVFGRLDEEIEALDAAGLAWSIVPGITAASASVASIGQSLTKRGRNGSVRFLTGHDMKGFADQDWRALAQPGEVAAIYMGKRAARWMQGRMLMHGAAPATPVTIIENASRADQRTIAATLATLPEAVADVTGPALLLHGLAPRRAAQALAQTEIAL
ncbi:siroheme synthase CysG [Jannaschia sp. M317]|uniref:siroheme synthase CysG n=1 Tax=Jannaschia sp. M317 TaxID=2867011 RepID=UPI0021A688CB|nr:siroheme synthase CysG [Jannaschia sp. M317]UWQ16282.1 siroheme synthase CysG [Jannaschia sp. M317]